MTGLTTVPPDLEAYLAAVRAALADVPTLERDDLLADVEASLADAAAESDVSLEARLGPPEQFAAELRSAAGLHPAQAEARRPSAFARRTRELVGRVAADPRAASARRVAYDLAPIWWVVRGYLAVGAVVWALDADGGRSTRYPLVPRFGTAEVGVAVVLLAVAASVALGLRMRARHRKLGRLAALVNVALALAALPVALEVTRSQTDLVAAADASREIVMTPPGLVYDGAPVTNVYPFSREGRLLHDVLLYDQYGRPLEIQGSAELDPDRRIPVGAADEPVFNAFPIRYYEPGTRRVARPNAIPPVEVPSIRTPRLPARGR